MYLLSFENFEAYSFNSSKLAFAVRTYLGEGTSVYLPQIPMDRGLQYLTGHYMKCKLPYIRSNSQLNQVVITITISLGIMVLITGD